MLKQESGSLLPPKFLIRGGVSRPQNGRKELVKDLLKYVLVERVPLLYQTPLKPLILFNNNGALSAIYFLRKSAYSINGIACCNNASWFVFVHIFIFKFAITT